MNALTGKGFWIWKIKDIEKGDPQAIADLLAAGGFTHAIVKVLDGVWSYNMRPYYDAAGNLKWADDILQPLVDALHAKGVLVYGFGYVYLLLSDAEATRARARVTQFGLDGWVIDAEVEAKGHPTNALVYAAGMKAMTVPVALSSYRFPTYHPTFPWDEFLEVCNFHMPQIYWEGSHNAGAQLIRSVKELRALKDMPVIPAGSAYYRGTWRATPADVRDFMDTAKDLGLPGVNFWSLYHARNMPDVYTEIAAYTWAGPPPPPPAPPPSSVPAMLFLTDYAYPWMIDQGYIGPRPQA
jgi:hypothetical protein